MHKFEFKYTMTIKGCEDEGPFTVAAILIEKEYYSYGLLGVQEDYYWGNEDDLNPYKE